MFLGKNIKNLRRFKNIDQEKLANAIGVKRATIANYENGTREPSIDKICLIANYFQLTIDDLVNKELLARKETVLFKNGEL
jgi:transcriptional regulator with XRE-family HTH domain